jgi:hypothetical protein
MVSETRTGVHINLSAVPKKVITALAGYIQYAELQEKDLKRAEDNTALAKNMHFSSLE